jgi:hypothetical protein
MMGKLTSRGGGVKEFFSGAPARDAIFSANYRFRVALLVFAWLACA